MFLLDDLRDFFPTSSIGAIRKLLKIKPGKYTYKLLISKNLTGDSDASL